MSERISEIGREYLRWTLIDGVGPILFTRLLERCGEMDALNRAPTAELEEVHGISREKAGRIAAQRSQVSIEAELAAAQEHNVRIICRADPEYPVGLRQIPDAPIVLYVRGELRPTDHIAVAIVGSRRCSIYGSEQSRRFGEMLATAGFTVVSGLARGIDAFAHHGAVDAGGRSIAVMGAGLDRVYPPENEALAHKVLGHGAWISELPIRTAVKATNFPARNRIIAGMTLGTIVVEAASRSGALITARLASEYNREVFAVPGRLQDPMAMGTNALIRDGGAKLVTCLEDILTELGDVGLEMRPQSAKGEDSSNGNGERDNDSPGLWADGDSDGDLLSSTEKRLLGALNSEPVSQDFLIQQLSLPVGEVLAGLTTLELKGRVRRLPGQLVARRAAAS